MYTQKRRERERRDKRKIGTIETRAVEKARVCGTGEEDRKGRAGQDKAGE